METDGFYNNVTELVDEYEDIIRTLTDQVDYYKDEQEKLKEHIENLIKENEELSKKLRLALESQQNSNFLTEDQIEDGEILTNIKSQLEYALQEKEYLTDLWQTSLKNIDQLEEELKLFEGRTHGYFAKSEVNKIKRNYEVQIKELQGELINSQKSLQDLLKTSKAAINSKTSDLQEALNEQKNLFKFVKKLEKDLSDLQDQQKEINELKDKLEKALKDKSLLNGELQHKIKESKLKVTEAVAVVEAALTEKDAALLREKKAIEEVASITKILEEMVNETQEKVRNETQLIKTKYEIKLNKYELELKSKNDEIKLKQTDLEQYKRECKLLEEQINRIQKGNICLDGSNTSKLLILEKNLESTFQKLLQAEKKLVQVTADKESIRDDMEQMVRHYQMDIQSRELEKAELQGRIKKLQEELEYSNTSLLKFADKVHHLNIKISSMDTDIKTKFEIKEETQKHLEEKMEAIHSMNKQIEADILKKLKKQMDINKIWKKEFEEVTSKLELRLKELKSEAGLLKKVNKELSVKLSDTEQKANDYKVNLEKLCSDVYLMAGENAT